MISEIGQNRECISSKLLAAQELLPVILFELVPLVILAGKGLDHAHPGQVFLQGGGEHGFLLLVGFVGLGQLA